MGTKKSLRRVPKVRAAGSKIAEEPTGGKEGARERNQSEGQITGGIKVRDTEKKGQPDLASLEKREAIQKKARKRFDQKHF